MYNYVYDMCIADCVYLHMYVQPDVFLPLWDAIYTVYIHAQLHTCTCICVHDVVSSLSMAFVGCNVHTYKHIHDMCMYMYMKVLKSWCN